MIIFYHLLQIDQLVDDMKQLAKGFGIRLEDPAFLEIKSKKPEDWIKFLQADFKENGNPLFVVSYSKDLSTEKSLYLHLKRFLLVEEGIGHQHIMMRGGGGRGLNDQKSRKSIISKILLQINAKLGKPLWLVEQPEQIRILG